MPVFECYYSVPHYNESVILEALDEEEARIIARKIMSCDELGCDCIKIGD